MGKIFNPEIMGMSRIFNKDEKFLMYHPCDLAMFNIKLIDNFWKQIVEYGNSVGGAYDKE